jgi:hypothetical protein
LEEEEVMVSGEAGFLSPYYVPVRIMVCITLTGPIGVGACAVVAGAVVVALCDLSYR